VSSFRRRPRISTPSRVVTAIGCGLAVVAAGARERIYETSCHTCSSLKPTKGGI
jgi:hypothetical protein